MVAAVLLGYSEDEGMDYRMSYPGTNESLGMNCARLHGSLICACQRAKILEAQYGSISISNPHRTLQDVSSVPNSSSFHNIVHTACCNSRKCTIVDLLKACTRVYTENRTCTLPP